MTTAMAFAPAVESRPFDESKHVHFTLGMLLGVDDFNQEFAYLAGRDRRFARDAFGYGTLSGLRVTLENDPAKGVRVAVTSGIAITPKGQVVCVRPSQCAYLDDWLAANAKQFDLAEFPKDLQLHVVLCYRDCATDLVPFPGGACRRDDELMVPSRLADSFRLELRTEAPKQLEEDRLIEFARWVRSIPSGAGSSDADLAAAIRSAIVAPMDAVRDPSEAAWSAPPAELTTADRDATMRAAMRVWITEVRPRLHSLCGGGTGGCCNAGGKDAPAPDECLLLAKITVHVDKDGQALTVPATEAAKIPDESRRPLLLHARMLQELAGNASAYRAIVAGVVGSGARPVLGNPTLANPADGKVVMTFDGFDANVAYVVKAMSVGDGPSNPIVAFQGIDANGITLNVTRNGAAVPVAELGPMQFMVEISRMG